MTRSIILICAAASLAGCSGISSTPLPPTSTPAPSLTPSPITSSTPTQLQEPTITATPEARQPGTCDIGALLDDIRAGTPYEQFAVHHNIVEDVSTLIVWFVDTELEAATGEVPVAVNQEIALRHALETIHRISKIDDCITADFDFINTVLVDSTYHGWLSGQLSPEEIRLEEQLDQESFARYLNSFQVSYLRSAPSELTLEGDCTWPEVEPEIWKHFSADRYNLAFYHVIDEFGINVWAQWDGSSELSVMLPNILNVIMEIGCLDERTNLIFMVVDDSGYTLTFGLVPELDIADLAILYEG